ncbi:DUF2062 domain-containing protein [Roseovarius salinarum]|uniref:DUF2062 domain-containing protein n=1 Tax=Roseovarius salinarum TaxID=1981892 RepID=UPI000C335498|nr:DUF2062 domain-containing protein [Roseovarius salinarum]
MVFKRRDRRPIWRIVADFFYPKGGWARAFHYVKHRLRRLPDPPHRIARGIFAGVFVTFTPFFGLHFFGAVALAWVIRGNIVASLLATFVGNPLTFLPIGVVSLQTGYFLLGREGLDSAAARRSLGAKSIDAWRDFKSNLIAIFTDTPANWSKLALFYDEVFFPYMVGGIIPGLVTGLIAYHISLPLIRAYRNRRKGVLKAKWTALREKAAAKADAGENQD